MNAIRNMTFYESIKVNPGIIAYDLHPDYQSSKLASNYSRQIASTVENFQPLMMGVQHHHAHIASCMAEIGLRQEVIGIAFDGTGYGLDGRIWGGEFFISGYSNFKRMVHFKYVPMPGGDAAVREPWRMALSYLYDSGKTLFFENSDLCLPLLKERWGPERTKTITTMLEKGINCLYTSSCGRLFDAVSSLLDYCDISTYEAEAAIRLEMAAMAAENGIGIIRYSEPSEVANTEQVSQVSDDGYKYRLEGSIVDFSETIVAIMDDLQSGQSREWISKKFHDTLVDVCNSVCRVIKERVKIDKVVLSGGVFQNIVIVQHPPHPDPLPPGERELICRRQCLLPPCGGGLRWGGEPLQNIYLLPNTVSALRKSGFTVFTHKTVPANDGGISLGQAFIAASRVRGVLNDYQSGM